MYIMYIYTHIIHTYIYTVKQLNLPTMEATLSGPFREVVGVVSRNMCRGDRLGSNKAIDIGSPAVHFCRGGRLERFYCVYIYIYIYIYIHTYNVQT